MSKLENLKAQATTKLGNVHADVMTYISALEDKVALNKMTWYGIGAVLVFLVIVVACHKLK